jgi:hypothetical protein
MVSLAMVVTPYGPENLGKDVGSVRCTRDISFKVEALLSEVRSCEKCLLFSLVF